MERAVVTKGVSTPGVLVLIHPDSDTSREIHFAGHASLIYHHLLSKLVASLRYRGVVAVGLEGQPTDLLPSQSSRESTDRLRVLDGATDPLGLGFAGKDMLDLSLAEAVVSSLADAVRAAARGDAGCDGASEGLGTDGERCAEGDDGDDGKDDGGSSVALGIDSLSVLIQRFGFKRALGLIRELRCIRNASPIMTVLYSDGLTHGQRMALEDTATTNVYIETCREAGHYKGDDMTRGRCLVVRRSQSGRVQEEEEWFSVVRDGKGGNKIEVSKRAPCPSSHEAGGGGAFGVSSTSADMMQSTAISSAAAEPSSGLDAMTSSFVDSLPFKLSLSEHEKDMRSQVVLPHQQQLGLSGDMAAGSAAAGVVGGFSIEHSFDDDDDIDDDLDI